MVRYFESNKEIDIVVEEKPVALTLEQKSEVGANWVETMKLNPSAFDGEVWSCRLMEENGEKVVLRVGITNYSVTTWGRKNNSEVPGTRSMGTAVLIFDRKTGGLILAKRTATVVNDKNKISVIGGVVDTSVEIGEGSYVDMTKKQAKKELLEELVVEGASELEYVGVAIGSGDKVEWCYAVEVNGVKIKDKTEAKELINVPRSEVPELVRRGNLELSTEWHLTHWAERIANSTGMEFIEMRGAE